MAPGYARPELLANTAWLAEHLDDPKVRIVDMGHYEGYARAHIPGAVHVGPKVSTFIKDADNPVYVMPPEPFAQLMERLGISDDTTVVAYDANGGNPSARLWWALEYYGHTGAELLNAGWNRWLAEGRPVTMTVPAPPKGAFTPRPNQGSICVVDELKSHVGDADVVPLDVRSLEEYVGTETRGNKRSGHIPGAVHLEWKHFVNDDDEKAFKSAEELRRLFEENGVTPEKLTVIY